MICQYASSTPGLKQDPVSHLFDPATSTAIQIPLLGFWPMALSPDGWYVCGIADIGYLFWDSVIMDPEGKTQNLKNQAIMESWKREKNYS